MNAAAYNAELFQTSVMHVPTKEEADRSWRTLANCDETMLRELRRQWGCIAIPSSGANSTSSIYGAVASMRSMGYQVEHAEALLDAGAAAFHAENCAELAVITARVYAALRQAPEDPTHPSHQYRRYHTWEEYCAAVPKWFFCPPPDLEAYRKKTADGWYGQLAAGTAGSQYEGYAPEEIARHTHSVKGYLTQPSVFNDDITYEIAFLTAYAAHGPAVTSQAIAEEWLRQIPMAMTAEGVALRNLRAGILPPESGLRDNYFREWIGAQMRGAICGMLAPCNCREAARLAWIDGCISHTCNGILGEVFSALLVSMAYSGHDMRQILLDTLEMIPADSEYAHILRRSVLFCERYASWREAWAQCTELLAEYTWVHAYPNAAAEVVAIWFGEDDFERTLEIMCLCGYDADCTAAQLLTAVSIRGGLENVHETWLAPARGSLETYLRGRETLTAAELIRETIAAYEKHLPA